MRIRPAHEDDETFVRACTHAACRHCQDRMDQLPAPMPGNYAARIQAGAVDIAERGEQPVGLIVHWPVDDHMFLDNVCVLPECA